MKHLLIFTLALVGFTCPACSGDQEGKGDGIAKDISAEEMSKVIDKDGIIILDVRTPGETANGMIPGAIEIDINSSSFKDKVAKLDKEKPVYIYCKSGGRSKKAQGILSEMGFKETYNLLGGFGEWSSKGLPQK